MDGNFYFFHRCTNYGGITEKMPRKEVIIVNSTTIQQTNNSDNLTTNTNNFSSTKRPAFNSVLAILPTRRQPSDLSAPALPQRKNHKKVDPLHSTHLIQKVCYSSFDNKLINHGKYDEKENSTTPLFFFLGTIYIADDFAETRVIPG